MTAQASRTVIT